MVVRRVSYKTLALWIKSHFLCPWSFCFVSWSLKFCIMFACDILTKRATLSPAKRLICKMFNLAFLSDKIKGKNKSPAIAKSISSCFCIETASYAAHQNASSLLPALRKPRKGVCVERGKVYGCFLLLTPGIGSGRVFLKGACMLPLWWRDVMQEHTKLLHRKCWSPGPFELQVNSVFSTCYLTKYWGLEHGKRLVCGECILLWHFITWMEAVNLCNGCMQRRAKVGKKAGIKVY